MNDVARAFAFMRRGDLHGTREEPWRFGTAVFTPELSRRHDSNYLVVEREAAAAELAAEAERVQCELAHRMLVVPDQETAARLRPGLEALGWETGRFLIMVHRREPVRPVDISAVVEVDEATLRPAREADLRQYPWATPAVRQQLLDARLLNPLETRFFAVLDEGRPVSFTDLYLDGDTAQVEAVATLPPYRGKGYASAVVVRAIQEARLAGASWIFLTADAGDWPQQLYRRLGFENAGYYYDFTRRLR